jgi:hypothetical protein
MEFFMTNLHIIIDNKKRTVNSAKIKNAAPDVFAVRTHLVGQFDDIGFKKDHPELFMEFK